MNSLNSCLFRTLSFSPTQSQDAAQRFPVLGSLPKALSSALGLLVQDTRFSPLLSHFHTGPKHMSKCSFTSLWAREEQGHLTPHSLGK